MSQEKNDEGSFSYKILSKDGKLTDYSGKFTLSEDALNWYKKHGMIIRSQFGRELILCQSGEPVNFNQSK